MAYALEFVQLICKCSSLLSHSLELVSFLFTSFLSLLKVSGDFILLSLLTQCQMIRAEV